MKSRLISAFAFLVRPFSPAESWPWRGWGAVTGEFCSYAEDNGILDDPCNTDRMPWEPERRASRGHAAAHGGNGWQTW